MNELEVDFVGVEDAYLKECFIDVFKGFKSLHSHKIILKRKNIRKTTMQAQPIINGHFFNRKRRAYAVYFRETTLIHEDIKVKDLPEDVLKGWYAHEFGHIVDYQNRGPWNMIWFGITYLLSEHRKCGAEKMADVYAVKNGFAKEIKAMKTYIIEHADIDPDYRARIKKYYPGPEEIESMVLEHNEESHI